MPFSDQDEPGRKGRRRGSRRGEDDGSFDDFWTRDSQGGGRGRRRGGPVPEGDPADVSDLTGPSGPRADVTRRSAPGPRRSDPPRRRGPASGAARPPAGRPPASRGTAGDLAAEPPGPVRGRGGGRGPGVGRAGLGRPGGDRPDAVDPDLPRRGPRAVPPAGPAAYAPRPADSGPYRAVDPPAGRPLAASPLPGGGPRRPVGGRVGRDRQALDQTLPGGHALGAASPPAGYRTSRAAGTGESRAVAPPRTTRWSQPGAYGDDGYRDDTYTDDYDDLDDDDYEDAELDELPSRRGCRRAVVALAVLVVMAVVAGWFAWSWVQGKIDPSGGPGEAVLVEIPEGTGTAAIGDVLADAGVISDATVWDWYTKLRDIGTIKAGRYEMRLNSSFDEAIDDLKSEPLPAEVTAMVTVPEGLTLQQVVARLSDPEKGVEGFTAEAVQQAVDDPAVRSAVLAADQRSIEGTLFPETYAVEEGDTPATVVKRMVQMFDKVADEVQLEAGAEALGLTPYQVVTVASMVEREAGTPQDGPKVARVIYNRLAAGEPLGIDATSCYEKGEIPCELTTAELEDNSPYDTRSRPGLPPTPIASPGRAGLEAALNPAEGDWLWYVLDAEADDGSSVFTSDYAEFQEAKQRCVEAGLGCG